MTLYILFILLQTFTTRHPDGSVTKDGQDGKYYTMANPPKPPKPCKKPPCAIPLTDYLPILALAGVALAIKKLR